MADLVERLSRWELHPEKTVTHRVTLKQAPEAYRVTDEGQCGKVVIVFGESERGKRGSRSVTLEYSAYFFFSHRSH